MGGCGGLLDVIAGLSSLSDGCASRIVVAPEPRPQQNVARRRPSVIDPVPETPLPGDPRAGHRAAGRPLRCSWRRQPPTISRISFAVSEGVLPTRTPAASRASFLAWAVPAEPDTMAPAWPIVLPSGAVNPATYPTTGFVTLALMKSAAR